ncbi:ribosome modulation factor [Methylocella silvestris]|uniref:ribosome modulation factor n=1 Tax=Methylocella silvestris TaxID=199596 RepID=UPI003D7C1E3F
MDEIASRYERAYRRGSTAFANGDTLGDNPYDRQTRAEAHEAWSDGWRDARDRRQGSLSYYRKPSAHTAKK